MRVTFVRTEGQKDRVYATRADGSEVSWSFASYGDGLPHDLIHLLVERAFGVRGGFWGRVEAGADPARINAAASRMGGKLADKYGGFGGELAELLLAEALANTAWASPDLDREVAIASAFGNAGREPPANAGKIAIALAAMLDETRDQWRALGTRGAITLEWPAR